jgi:hypothetical protein
MSSPFEGYKNTVAKQYLYQKIAWIPDPRMNAG